MLNTWVNAGMAVGNAPVVYADPVTAQVDIVRHLHGRRVTTSGRSRWTSRSRVGLVAGAAGVIVVATLTLVLPSLSDRSGVLGQKDRNPVAGAATSGRSKVAPATSPTTNRISNLPLAPVHTIIGESPNTPNGSTATANQATALVTPTTNAVNSSSTVATAVGATTTTTTTSPISTPPPSPTTTTTPTTAPSPAPSTTTTTAVTDNTPTTSSATAISPNP